MLRGEYLKKVSSAYARLYSFSQHRLIWFGLGAQYNRKKSEERAQRGEGRSPVGWPAPLHAGLAEAPPLPPTTHYLECSCSCMCPPIGRIMRDASSPGSDRMLRSIYTLLHMRETVKTHSQWSRRSDRKQISWLASHSQSARESTISK